MKKKNSSGFSLQVIASLGAVTAVLLPIFLSSTSWPTAARDYLELYGTADSGAVNLVSAIYLGYRAFDTFGETIVLLVAVSGTIGILIQAGAILAEGYESFETRTETSADGERLPEVPAFTLSGEKRKSHVLRTHLLEVVTGKLGPIVLMFGFYVMLYGHLSPGGGFQGGVVIASGIVFLALGNGLESTTRLTRALVLARIEAVAFLALVLASISGILFGTGYFSNPMQNLAALPAAFIILLNAVIGMKVGTSIGFMCIAIMGKETQ